MPIYLDRHHIDGVTAEGVAAAHKLDLQCQHGHDVEFMTYWVDHERGSVFCLVNAPDKEAVEAAHREAHGLVPADIVAVDPVLVEAFLGRIKDPEPVSKGDAVIDESAFRVVMFTDMEGSTRMTSGLGDAEAMRILRHHDQLVRAVVGKHEGRVVKHTGDGFLLSFASTQKAVQAAVEVQQELDRYNAMATPPIRVRIGLSAGEPLAEDGDLFGATVQQAARICAAAPAGCILCAPVVRQLCLGKTFRFETFGLHQLDGFQDELELVTVTWK
jgi:class 3 adenylate cyclase